MLAVKHQLKILFTVVRSLSIFTGAGCATYYKPPGQGASFLNSSIEGTVDDETNADKPVRAFVFKIDGVRVATEKSARCNWDEARIVSPGAHVITVGYSVGKSWTGGLVGYSDFSMSFQSNAKYRVMGQYSGDRSGQIVIHQLSPDFLEVDKKSVELKEHPQRGIPPGFAAMVDSCLIP